MIVVLLTLVAVAIIAMAAIATYFAALRHRHEVTPAMLDDIAKTMRSYSTVVEEIFADGLDSADAARMPDLLEGYKAFEAAEQRYDGAKRNLDLCRCVTCADRTIEADLMIKSTRAHHLYFKSKLDSQKQ